MPQGKARGTCMRYIAVVEDEDESAELLSGYIAKFAAESGQTLQVDRYRDGAEFLAGYKAKYAVVFMDVQMPCRDGLVTSEELRRLDKTVSLIFVTNLVKYAQKGYEVDAIAYIVKPVRYYDFALKLRKALDVYAMNEKHDLVLNTADGVCMISTDKLMYVEILRHRLYYHLVDGVVEMTGVLSKAEEQLKAYGFLRCNQCYLVNPTFIVGVKGGFVELGSERLAISRPRKKSFMAELSDWCSGQERKE